MWRIRRCAVSHGSRGRLFPSSIPLENVAIDILGPLMRSLTKHRLLLVINCRYSKLAWVVPPVEITAWTVAKAFLPAGHFRRVRMRNSSWITAASSRRNIPGGMPPLQHQEEVYYGISPADERAGGTLQQDHTGGISSIRRGAPASLARVRRRARLRLQYKSKPHNGTATVLPDHPMSPAPSLPPHLQKKRFMEHIRRLMASPTPGLPAARRRHKDGSDRHGDGSVARQRKLESKSLGPYPVTSATSRTAELDKGVLREVLY